MLSCFSTRGERRNTLPPRPVLGFTPIDARGRLAPSSRLDRGLKSLEEGGGRHGALIHKLSGTSIGVGEAVEGGVLPA